MTTTLTDVDRETVDRSVRADGTMRVHRLTTSAAKRMGMIHQWPAEDRTYHVSTTGRVHDRFGDAMADARRHGGIEATMTDGLYGIAPTPCRADQTRRAIISDSEGRQFLAWTTFGGECWSAPTEQGPSPSLLYQLAEQHPRRIVRQCCAGQTISRAIYLLRFSGERELARRLDREYTAECRAECEAEQAARHEGARQ